MRTAVDNPALCARFRFGPRQTEDQIGFPPISFQADARRWHTPKVSPVLPGRRGKGSSVMMGLRSSAAWTIIKRRCATASLRWTPFPSGRGGQRVRVIAASGSPGEPWLTSRPSPDKLDQFWSEQDATFGASTEKSGEVSSPRILRSAMPWNRRHDRNARDCASDDGAGPRRLANTVSARDPEMGMQSSVAKVRQAIDALTRAGRDATGDRPSRPAIPTTPDETGPWLTAPAEAALQRQRPLP